MITDEMVRKYRLAYGAAAKDSGIAECDRAALEAVAPMILAPLQAENKALRNFAVVAEERMETFLAERPKLIAQGMREAAKEVSNWNGLLEFEGRTKLVDHLLARAQELDPK